MSSATPVSPTYLELWKELLEVFIKPVLKEGLYSSNPTRGLPPRLKQHQYDENFYPFLYDHIIGALEAYCEETMLPKLLNLRGINLIMEARYTCLQDIHFKTVKLWYPILVLERTYLYVITSSLKRQFPALGRRSGEVFRKGVYPKIADLLREAAFECISDSFTVRSEGTFNNYLELLQYIRANDGKFFDEEWNIFAHSKLVEKVHDSFMLASKSLQEFLKSAENLLISSRTIFKLSTGKHKKKIQQALFRMRDDRIFGNGAEVFKMILMESDGKTLKETFNTFGNDKEFLNCVALQSLKVFSELVDGNGQTLKEDWLNEQNIFRRLFVFWLRLQKIPRIGDKNEQTIHETLIVPFVTVINTTFPDSIVIVSVLAQYCQQLFSRIYQGQTELEPNGIREIRAILSLTSYLPSTDSFHEPFRTLLSKALLEGTSDFIKVKQLSSLPTSRDRMDVISDIFAMLDDATTWPLYEREMFSTITTFWQKYGKIDFEPKIVRRSRWDLESDIGLVFPGRIRLLSRTILEHLHSWHPMRCASIHSSLGAMKITANFWTFRENDVRIELSTAQGCVLMLFEETEALTLGDVAKSVLSIRGKPWGFDAIVAIIKSMMTEHAILLKRPENSKFRYTDIICLNSQFRPETEHITLPSPEYSDENRKSMQTGVTTVLTRYHKMAIEASVMKVLKRERVMDLHQLKEMVCSKLTMKETLGTVSFEEVIERLERDEYLTVDNTIARYID